MRLFLIGFFCLIGCVSCNRKEVFPIAELTEVRVARKVFQKEKPQVVSQAMPQKVLPIKKADTLPVKPMVTVVETKEMALDTISVKARQQQETSVLSQKQMVQAEPQETESVARKYHVITGSLAQADMKNLERIIAQIEELGYTPVTLPAGSRTRLSIGGYPTQKAAQQALEEYVAKSHVKGCWVLYVKN